MVLPAESSGRASKTRDFSPRKDREEPVAVGSIGRHDIAVQNAAGSLALLVELLCDELFAVREYIRDRGAQMRGFIRENFRVNIQMDRLIALYVRYCQPHVPRPIEGDQALLSISDSSVESQLKVSAASLLDLGLILTTDDVEPGIIRRFQLFSKPWSSIPEREKSTSLLSPNASEFQLFNHPISIEEDEERMSNPSTIPLDAEMKISTLEAQLAALSRQMQLLLENKKPVLMSSDKHCAEPVSPLSSESSDEGVCLVSVPSSHRGSAHEECLLPPVCPPSFLPPPPPPPIKGCGSQPAHRREPVKPLVPHLDLTKRESIISDDDQTASSPLPNRPSAMDLKRVQLRKTNTARSPGGTPLNKCRGPMRSSATLDQGSFLATALREKFRSMHNSVCEEENETFNADNSWVDEA